MTTTFVPLVRCEAIADERAGEEREDADLVHRRFAATRVEAVMRQLGGARDMRPAAFACDSQPGLVGTDDGRGADR